MNSGLQCLSNSKELTMLFIEQKYEINCWGSFGTKGRFAKAYAAFVHAMWLEKEDTFTPTEVKKIISQFNSQFEGFHQQDSQELITTVLDCLQEDTNSNKERKIYRINKAVSDD